MTWKVTVRAEEDWNDHNLLLVRATTLELAVDKALTHASKLYEKDVKYHATSVARIHATIVP